MYPVGGGGSDRMASCESISKVIDDYIFFI